MTDYYDFFVPENKFVVPVTVLLSNADQVKLRKFINLHYLGDVNCNELDENGHFVPKYPEKETQEFKDAMWKSGMSVDYQVKVVYSVDGTCKMELL